MSIIMRNGAIRLFQLVYNYYEFSFAYIIKIGRSANTHYRPHIRLQNKHQSKSKFLHLLSTNFTMAVKHVASVLFLCLLILNHSKIACDYHLALRHIRKKLNILTDAKMKNQFASVKCACHDTRALPFIFMLLVLSRATYRVTHDSRQKSNSSNDCISKPE